MTTPIAGNPISMNDVYNETNLNRNMDNFFDVANVGGGGGLMYHNLAMGLSSNLTAKSAIYDQYNSGTNMNLSYWYNYTQDANMIISWKFTNNNTENDVDVNLGFSDGNPASTQNFVALSLPSAGGQDIQDDYNTNLPANTTFPGGLYDVRCDVSAFFVGGGRPPGAGVNNNNTSASDTDGVGPGTARGVQNIPNFDSFNPLTQVLIVDGNISGANLIYINKRTTVNVDFN